MALSNVYEHICAFHMSLFRPTGAYARRWLRSAVRRRQLYAARLVTVLGEIPQIAALRELIRVVRVFAAR